MLQVTGINNKTNLLSQNRESRLATLREPATQRDTLAVDRQYQLQNNRLIWTTTDDGVARSRTRTLRCCGGGSGGSSSSAAAAAAAVAVAVVVAVAASDDFSLTTQTRHRLLYFLP